MKFFLCYAINLLRYFNLWKKYYSKFSSNSEALASEILQNLEYIFHRTHVHCNISFEAILKRFYFASKRYNISIISLRIFKKCFLSTTWTVMLIKWFSRTLLCFPRERVLTIIMWNFVNPYKNRRLFVINSTIMRVFPLYEKTRVKCEKFLYVQQYY